MYVYRIKDLGSLCFMHFNDDSQMVNHSIMKISLPPQPPLSYSYSNICSLRKQLTFCDATTTIPK